jgi:hypothetical protein
MRFRTEQRFEAGLAAVMAQFCDPDLYPTLTGLPKISAPVVLDHSADGLHVHLRLHQRFTGDLPPAALAVVDPSKLSWVEEIDFDLGRAAATTRLLPDHYADRLSCSGRYTFVASGPGLTARRLEGDLKVRMALVGGKVEGALVSGLREHAADEQPLIAARLATT